MKSLHNINILLLFSIFFTIFKQGYILSQNIDIVYQEGFVRYYQYPANIIYVQDSQGYYDMRSQQLDIYRDIAVKNLQYKTINNVVNTVANVVSDDLSNTNTDYYIENNNYYYPNQYYRYPNILVKSKPIQINIDSNVVFYEDN